jgi:purine-binding chemotaxis protein CheW
MSGHRQSDQFVTLGLDQEVFAVPVEVVREILDMRQPFRIPDAPVHLAGLIDVRGHAVPVIDLRLKLGLPARAASADTRILVLEVLIADRVFEVTALDAGSLSPPPDIGSMWRSDYIEGIGRRGDNFVVIFDVSRLLSSEDVALLRATAPPAAQPAMLEA